MMRRRAAIHRQHTLRTSAFMLAFIVALPMLTSCSLVYFDARYGGGEFHYGNGTTAVSYSDEPDDGTTVESTDINTTDASAETGGATTGSDTGKTSGTTAVPATVSTADTAGTSEPEVTSAQQSDTNKSEAVTAKYAYWLIDDVYMRRSLSASEKTLYDRVLASVANLAESCEVNDLTLDSDTVFNVVNAVYYDHAELFWFTGNTKLSIRTRNDVPIGMTLTFSYYYNEAQINALIAQIEAATSNVIDMMAAADTYGAIKLAYDSVIAFDEYDDAGALLVGDSASAGRPCMTIVGAFIDGKVICTGYTRAIQYLLGRRGIVCAYIGGEKKPTGEKHAWNVVVADGNAYNIDATWDDTMSTPDALGADPPLYAYFCVNDDEFMRTHSVDPEFSPPKCTSTAFDYFRREGRYFDEYDADAVAAALTDAILRGDVPSVKFGSDDAYKKAKADLINGGAFYKILANATTSVSHINTNKMTYLLADEERIIKFYI